MSVMQWLFGKRSTGDPPVQIHFELEPGLHASRPEGVEEVGLRAAWMASRDTVLATVWEMTLDAFSEIPDEIPCTTPVEAFELLLDPEVTFLSNDVFELGTYFTWDEDHHLTMHFEQGVSKGFTADG